MTMQHIVPDTTEIRPAVVRKKKPSPRLRRTIDALVTRYPFGGVSREELDRISGSSNGPDIVYQLRQKYIGDDGVISQKIAGFDRDGQPCKVGYYSLSEAGYQRILEQGLYHG